MTTDDQLDNEAVALATEEDSEREEELATPDDEQGAGKKTLGVERWVQLSYVFASLAIIWLYDHVISAAWYVFADPDEGIVTAAAIAAGLASTVALYKQRAVYEMVHDTVDELSKVSWPTRKETSSSTVIVVVTSIVAALMLFLFDSVWSAVTDLVYKV